MNTTSHHKHAAGALCAGVATTQFCAFVLASAVSLLPSPVQASVFTWSGIFSDRWSFGSGGGPTNWGVGIPDADDDVFFNQETFNYDVDIEESRSVLSVIFGGSNDYLLFSGGTSSDVLTLVDGDVTATGTATHRFDVHLSMGSSGTWSIDNPLVDISRLITGNTLNKVGTGQLLLSDDEGTERSRLRTLYVSEGTVVIDRADIDLTSNSSLTSGPLAAAGADITIQNAADVQMTAKNMASAGLVKDATLTVSGSGTSLTGAGIEVSINNDGTTGRVVVEQGATLDITRDLIMGFNGLAELRVQTGASASIGKLALGAHDYAWGDAVVTGSNSSLSATTLMPGGYSTLIRGGKGTLTVDDGAVVQVTGQTKFMTSRSSITIDGGMLDTKQLTGYDGVRGTVNISDPAGGTALTVGTDDGSSTFKGLIQDAAGGPGSLLKTGTGTFILTNNNTYTGGTTISAGTLSVGDGGDMGGIAGDVENNGTLIFNRSTGVAIDDTISGSGSVAMQGGGVLYLTADNSYTGGTTIVSGSGIVVGDGDAAGSIVGDVENDGWLAFDRSNAVALGGAISGSGSLTMDGGGVLTLTGDNSYAGGTTISTGTLLANNTTGSATGTGNVTVTGGGTLGGTGSVAGAVTSNSGSTIAPGASAGILTVGDVVFESGSTFDIELAGVDEFDQLVVNGTASIDSGSTLDVSYIDAFAAVPGDAFVIISAGSISGEFSNVTWPDGQDWVIEYGAGTVTIGVEEIVLCPGDVDGDGSVGFGDLVALLAAWGPCVDCAADLDGDGSVGFNDLVALLAGWGECP